MVIQGGAPIVTGTGDQTGLGRGTGINTAAFAQSPVGFFGVTEYSYLAEISTSGRERGLVEISTDLVKRSLNSFLTGIAAQIAGLPASVLAPSRSFPPMQLFPATQDREQLPASSRESPMLPALRISR